MQPLELNDPQRELLKLMAAGRPIRTAAAELRMSTHMANAHLRRARLANGARNDTTLVVRYRMQQAGR